MKPCPANPAIFPGIVCVPLLSLIAYLLAHWGHLSREPGRLPRWGAAARTILEEVLPQAVIEGLLTEIEKRSALLRSHGIEVQVNGCKI